MITNTQFSDVTAFISSTLTAVNDPIFLAAIVGTAMAGVGIVARIFVPYQEFSWSTRKDTLVIDISNALALATALFAISLILKRGTVAIVAAVFWLGLVLSITSVSDCTSFGCRMQEVDILSKAMTQWIFIAVSPIYFVGLFFDFIWEN